MNIDISLVRSLIVQQFPKWSGLSIKPVELSGWDNRTFRLGDDMSVRMPSNKSYEAQVVKEQQWLPLLAPHLPVTIPTPLAMGKPSDEYPLQWSVYRWIDGENATPERISNLNDFAVDLAQFLNSLQKVKGNSGPPPGPHNFYRGGPLSTYNRETRNAIVALDGLIDSAEVTAVWEKALQSEWNASPIWVHGDMYPTNLLVKEGRLCAVIDFGCSGVGDPACDLTIAWTFFSGQSREMFQSQIQVDHKTWERARGWALWKALITIARPSGAPAGRLEESHRVIQDIIRENKGLS